MKLDIKKWNEVRKQLEAHIKETKHSIRRVEKPVLQFQKTEDGKWKMLPTGHMYRGGTSDEYDSMRNMKWDATSLYAVRAACRGKQHCPEWSIEDAKERILPQYALPSEKEDTVSSSGGE